MALVMKADKAFDPINISAPGADAVMFETDLSPHLIQ
jgi:hypothetical protein